MTTTITASTLKAILCYIDAEKTPKVCYDNDELTMPLITHIKNALGDKDGSQSVSISFSEEQKELKRQFNGIAKNIKSIFDQIEYCTQNHY